MPTPFMHLAYADALLEDSRLHPEIRPILQQNLPAFYLGNIAPDYQAICDIHRSRTHFYQNPMPRTEENVGYVQLLNEYPILQDARNLTIPEAVFQAGYNAHLSYDIDWLRMILIPFIFGNDDGWGEIELKARFKSHHSLLTYLDRQALHLIQETHQERLNSVLESAEMPTFSYLHTEYLDAWKYEISHQLLPNVPSKTVEVYSKRLRITPEEFLEWVDDPDWLEVEVFNRIPRPSINVYQETAQEHAINRLNQYLSVII